MDFGHTSAPAPKLLFANEHGYSSEPVGSEYEQQVYLQNPVVENPKEARNFRGAWDSVKRAAQKRGFLHLGSSGTQTLFCQRPLTLAGGCFQLLPKIIDSDLEKALRIEEVV